jgi:hypothetical protein
MNIKQILCLLSLVFFLFGENIMFEQFCFSEEQQPKSQVTCNELASDFRQLTNGDDGTPTSYLPQWTNSVSNYTAWVPIN